MEDIPKFIAPHDDNTTTILIISHVKNQKIKNHISKKQQLIFQPLPTPTKFSSRITNYELRITNYELYSPSLYNQNFS